LDRYAAWNANFVPVVSGPHSGPRRAKRARKTLATSRGLRWDIKGGARDWLELDGAGTSVRAARQGGSRARRLDHCRAANLVGNAVKFTPSGGRVTITLERSAQHAQIIIDSSKTSLLSNQSC
jgi:hypothetical protein